jgi:hypothetical protein
VAIDYAALKTELQTDPKGLGLAVRVAAGDDDGAATLLNTAGLSGETVQDGEIPKGTFLLSLAPNLLSMASLSAALQEKWDRIINAVAANATVHITHPHVIACVDAAVADGILTADDGAATKALGTRSCSRAEKLFGAGVVVTDADVARALRGN